MVAGHHVAHDVCGSQSPVHQRLLLVSHRDEHRHDDQLRALHLVHHIGQQHRVAGAALEVVHLVFPAYSSATIAALPSQNLTQRQDAFAAAAE
jgi:hypothetical protein